MSVLCALPADERPEAELHPPDEREGNRPVVLVDVIERQVVLEEFEELRDFTGVEVVGECLRALAFAIIKMALTREMHVPPGHDPAVADVLGVPRDRISRSAAPSSRDG